MSNYGNAFFSPESKQYPGSVVPVWLEVKERKIAGGTIDISGYKKGTIIPAGIPVNLPKMGGTATLLDAFVVVGAVGSTDTTVVLKSASGVIKDPSGLVVGKVTETTGIAAKAVKLDTGTESTTEGHEGEFSFTITANALGSLSDGDLVYLISAAGSNKAVLKPTGLSWRQIYIDSDNATLGTVAVVTKGQVLADRIPAISDYFKSLMPGITFEYES